jgi:hypothetical protein
MAKVTKEQLKALLATPLSIAASIAAVTPTKVDDGIVLGLQKVTDNDLALGALVAMINKLSGSIDATNGQLAPNDLAGVYAAIDALPA